MCHLKTFHGPCKSFCARKWDTKKKRKNTHITYVSHIQEVTHIATHIYIFNLFIQHQRAHISGMATFKMTSLALAP